MLCPICLKYQIRRSWADFLIAKKVCPKCQKSLDAHFDIKQIPFYQSSMKYIYLSYLDPVHEMMLLVKAIHKQNVYFLRQRILNFTNEEYLGLILNRDSIIVFSEFLKLDDLEALEHFQTLNIIELRDMDML